MENLQKRIDAVSEDAVAEYKKSGPQLLRQINQWITDEQQKSRFLGGNSVDLLLNNHRNHHGFISQILSLRDAKGLEKALPWVYSAYHNQGVPLDYFKEEFEEWIRLIKIHITHAEELVQLYQWMLDSHAQRCDELHSSVAENYIDPDHPFLKAIIKGDHRSAFKYAQSRVSNWLEFEQFFINPVQPSLYEVGLLWEGGHLSVASEHLATAVVNRVLSELLFSIDLPDITKPKILVTCVSSEFHQLGSWMVATALEADGWDVDYMGADTPPDSIMKILEEEEYYAMLVSVTMPYNLQHAQELIDKVRESCPETKIILGGQAFSFISDATVHFRADLIANSYFEAVNALNTQGLQR